VVLPSLYSHWKAGHAVLCFQQLCSEYTHISLQNMKGKPLSHQMYTALQPGDWLSQLEFSIWSHCQSSYSCIWPPWRRTLCDINTQLSSSLYKD